MENQLFKEYPAIQRIEHLEANAESFDTMTYSKQLSQEEIEKIRAEFTQLAIEISVKEDEFKDVKDEFKASMKPMKDQYKGSMKMLKSRSVDVKERVYVMKDFSEKMVGIYNNQGELISSRRMTADEGQLSINSSLRIAQNS